MNEITAEQIVNKFNQEMQKPTLDRNPMLQSVADVCMIRCEGRSVIDFLNFAIYGTGMKVELSEDRKTWVAKRNGKYDRVSMPKEADHIIGSRT
jgi:hypothetical protein